MSRDLSLFQFEMDPRGRFLLLAGARRGGDRGQGGAPAGAAEDKRLDVGEERRRLSKRRKCRQLKHGVPLVVGQGGSAVSRFRGRSGKAARELGCRSSLRRDEACMERCGHSQVGSNRQATSPAGGHDTWRARTAGCIRAGSRRIGQAADLAVGQAVVDGREEFARCCHSGDVATPAIGDAVVVVLEPGPSPVAADGLDGGPAHQPGALLGDQPSPHRGVGLVMSRGQKPGPAAQLASGGEAPHVADLGTKDGAEHRPDPGQAWMAV